MISESRNNRENADLLKRVSRLAIDVCLFRVIEERIMMVVNIVNTDLENALAFVFRVRLDELHANIEMMEWFHAEIVLLAIIFDITSIINMVFVRRKCQIEVFFKCFVRIDGRRQRNGITCSEHPRQ